MSKYEKCKICKHVCYDEAITTCNHPVGFGPDGECPIYGNDEEEAECFIYKVIEEDDPEHD